MGCYAHGGDVKERGINRQDDHRSNGTSEAGHYAKYQTSSGNSDGSKDWTNSKAKEKHHGTLREMKSLPKPKLKGLAKGGKVDMYAMEPDVPAMHGYAEGGEAKYERLDPDKAAAAQRGAQQVPSLKEGWENIKNEVSSWMPTGPGAQAQEVEHKADGGEIGDDVDNELSEMAADELMAGIKSGDKKQILEAIKAIVMSCKE